MKTLMLCLALVSSVEAGEMPELSFGSARSQPLPLTLLESAKQNLPPMLKTAAQRVAAVRRKLISRMPIVQPPAGVADRMPIKTPDPKIDYKLLVKEPGVESRQDNEP